MDILVAYDVNTETREGRRRLRKVATVCKDYGQRVQYSVFECRVTEAQMETLRERLLKILDEDEDNLRIYRLRAPREDFVECYGKDGYVSFDDPLIY
jgi:CRISPR-associated protein Cas2